MATQKKNKPIFDIREYEFRNNKAFIEHNKGLYNLIKYILKEVKDEPERIIYLSRFIFEISDNKLLLSTLGLFKNQDFKNLFNIISVQIRLQNNSYSKEEITRIFSMVTSNYLRRQFLIDYKFDTRFIKKFDFTLRGCEIEFPDTYIISEKMQKQFNLNINKFLSELEVKEYVNELLDYDYINDTSNFKNDVKYLQNKIENKITNVDVLEVESQDIFKSNGLTLFLKWEKICKEDPYKKYSYIFQKLKQLEKLRKTDFKSISSWLNEKSYISKETYKEFLEIGHFVTPKNIILKSRNTLFDSII